MSTFLVRLFFLFGGLALIAEVHNWELALGVFLVVAGSRRDLLVVTKGHNAEEHDERVRDARANWPRHLREES